jgi:hypothetical protein
MSRKRCHRTQIVNRITYNLAYEATRRSDNEQDLFGDKAVYEMTFLPDAEEVLNIYKKKAPKKSYGIREEFRVGGGAIKEMMNCLDGMVRLAFFTFGVSVNLMEVCMTGKPNGINRAPGVDTIQGLVRISLETTIHPRENAEGLAQARASTPKLWSDVRIDGVSHAVCHLHICHG